MKTESPLTSLEYARHNGAECPVCLGDALEKTLMQSDDAGSHRFLTVCSRCRSSWMEVCKITGYLHLCPEVPPLKLGVLRPPKTIGDL